MFPSAPHAMAPTPENKGEAGRDAVTVGDIESSTGRVDDEAGVESEVRSKRKFRVMVVGVCGRAAAVAGFWIKSQHATLLSEKIRKQRTWSKCPTPLSSSSTN